MNQAAARKAVHTRRMKALSIADLDRLYALAIEIKDKEREIDNDFTIESFIAEHIGPTTWKSFCRFGDRRSATSGLILYWIRKDGMSLDEQAMHMSNDYGREISPEDLARFMMDFDRGKSIYPPYQELQQLKDLFKELSGFSWEPRFVKAHILSPVTEDETLPF